MHEQIESFLLQIPDLENQSPANLIDYFAYYLTIIENRNDVQALDIEVCFNLSRLKKYSNTSSYLLHNSKAKRGKKPKYVKTQDGYQLERSHQLDIQKSLHTGPAKIETSHLLRGLLSKLKDKKEQSFLQEAIDCYEIGARRAAIVLVWVLTIYHLYEYIFKNELASFNSALAKNKDKRIKVAQVTRVDDFTDIPEAKFIEIARSAKIISNDLRKILDAKLGIRNSYAHPSAITVSEVKTTDFIIDLVENVIIKYQI
jgi:hypothetical protein